MQSPRRKGPRSPGTTAAQRDAPVVAWDAAAGSIALASARRTIDLLDIPIALLDLEGRILHVNPANERLLGRTVDELRGQAIGSTGPDERSEPSGGFLAFLLERGTLNGEFANQRPDGTVVHVDMTAQIVRSDDGVPRWIVATGHDLGPRLAQLEQFNASALSVLTASGDDLLVEIVRVARELLGARHAALGVVEDGALVRFIPDGMSDAQIAGIAHWPEGRGLLGAMVTEYQTVRTPKIRSDPRSSGFPLGHPPMESFLRTTIRTADEVYGHLYFTEKLESAEFSFVDERIAELFASHAAIAIRDGRRRDEAEEAGRSLAEAQRIAHIGSWDRDIATGVLRWSDESCRIFGIEPGTFGGTLEAYLAFVHPDDRMKAAPSREVLARSSPSETEYRIVRADGAMRILHEVGVVIRDAAGSPIRYVGSTQDITERLQLEEQQTRFARLLDELASEIYIIDAKTLRFTQANAGVLRNVGYSMDELRELTPMDLKPSFTRATYEGLVAPLVAGERDQVTFEAVHRRKDGSTYPVEVRVHFLPNETPAVFVSIVQDTAERLAANDERTLLASAIEQTAEAIIMQDLDGTISYVNPSACRLYGYEPGEMIGQHARMLDSGHHSPAFWSELWTSVNAGRTWTGTIVNRRKDGSLVEVEATISHVLDARGRPAHFLHTDRDVTRERALQDALERDAHEREMIRAALERINPAASPEEITASACAELIKVAGIESAWAVELGPEHGRILAVDGLVTSMFQPGQPLPVPIARYLFGRASSGAWAEDWRSRPEYDAISQQLSASGLLSAAYAPLAGAHGVIGVIGFGTHDPANSAQLVERLPALATFGSIVGALIAPGIGARFREADGRAIIQTILDAGGFGPFFQPIVDLSTGAVLGYEALTRFTDGRRPDLVFSAAAQAGLGIALEVATLTATIAAATAQLPPIAYLSLNVSPELVHAGYLGQLLAGQTRPIVLEITEHVAVDDYPEFRRELSALGPTVSIAVDDAGAGYASFRHILELAPQAVKLDIALVRGINADPARQALIAGMSYFAVRRKIHLIAEGIETSAELQTLRSLGIHFGQGYLLGRPQDGRGNAPWPTSVALGELQDIQ